MFQSIYSHNSYTFIIGLSVFSLAGLFSLVQCLWIKPGVYLRVEHLKGTLLMWIPALSENILLGWDKHSSLVGTFVNYSLKMFTDIEPRTKP
jgi:hypothetical protein